MIAALPMYDMPYTAQANDRFWSLICENLPQAPKTLLRNVNPWKIWQSSELLLAQTCSLPYRTGLYAHVTLVGTPDYGLMGCPPGTYNSVIAIRADKDPEPLEDYAQALLAYNEPLSQSGWAAAQNSGLGRGAVVQTGSHAASAFAVSIGKADITSIDALTWRMLGWNNPEMMAKLQIIARTKPTPCLPYITAKGNDPEPIADAVRAAISRLEPKFRAVLSLKGLIDISHETYLAEPLPQLPPMSAPQDGG